MNNTGADMAKKPKPLLTPWFPANARPDRVGVYEIQGSRFDGSNFRRWNGKGWSGTWAEPNDYVGMDFRVLYRAGEDMTGWRGLASDPGAAA
jgi:hypothetical protein